MGKKKFHQGFGQETRDEMRKAQHGKCKLCEQSIVDFHHKLHNTKVNNKLFPNYIHSVFNCVGLCRDCHDHRKHEFKVGLTEAAVYEHALSMLKMDIFR